MQTATGSIEDTASPSEVAVAAADEVHAAMRQPTLSEVQREAAGVAAMSTDSAATVGYFYCYE